MSFKKCPKCILLLPRISLHLRILAFPLDLPLLFRKVRRPLVLVLPQLLLEVELMLMELLLTLLAGISLTFTSPG